MAHIPGVTEAIQANLSLCASCKFARPCTSGALGTMAHAAVLGSIHGHHKTVRGIRGLRADGMQPPQPVGILLPSMLARLVIKLNSSGSLTLQPCLSPCWQQPHGVCSKRYAMRSCHMQQRPALPTCQVAPNACVKALAAS